MKHNIKRAINNSFPWFFEIDDLKSRTSKDSPIFRKRAMKRKKVAIFLISLPWEIDFESYASVMNTMRKSHTRKIALTSTIWTPFVNSECVHFFNKKR
jgi:23S rRNA A2030 N6-methylase RlmJ